MLEREREIKAEGKLRTEAAYCLFDSRRDNTGMELGPGPHHGVGERRGEGMVKCDGSSDREGTGGCWGGADWWCRPGRRRVQAAAEKKTEKKRKRVCVCARERERERERAGGGGEEDGEEAEAGERPPQGQGAGPGPPPPPPHLTRIVRRRPGRAEPGCGAFARPQPV
jgi:hypothetical protein